MNTRARQGGGWSPEKTEMWIQNICNEAPTAREEREREVTGGQWSSKKSE